MSEPVFPMPLKYGPSFIRTYELHLPLFGMQMMSTCICVFKPYFTGNAETGRVGAIIFTLRQLRLSEKSTRKEMLLSNHKSKRLAKSAHIYIFMLTYCICIQPTQLFSYPYAKVTSCLNSEIVQEFSELFKKIKKKFKYFRHISHIYFRGTVVHGLQADRLLIKH